jgi:hypothetical protein
MPIGEDLVFDGGTETSGAAKAEVMAGGLLDEMIAAVGAVEKRGAEKLLHYTEKLLHYTDHAVLLYVLTS